MTPEQELCRCFVCGYPLPEPPRLDANVWTVLCDSCELRLDEESYSLSDVEIEDILYWQELGY